MRPLLQFCLLQHSLFLTVACHERGGSGGDFGTLFGQAQSGKGARNALGRDARHRVVDLAENVPGDRTRYSGQACERAKREKKLGLDAVSGTSLRTAGGRRRLWAWLRRVDLRQQRLRCCNRHFADSSRLGTPVPAGSSFDLVLMLDMVFGGHEQSDRTGIVRSSRSTALKLPSVWITVR